MESQVHKKPKLTDGQRGGHLCHKCGWLFPNPHPSYKARRAHKRVCGTIQGYRLDNDEESKNLVEGEIDVERTGSRRTSNGDGREVAIDGPKPVGKSPDAVDLSACTMDENSPQNSPEYDEFEHATPFDCQKYIQHLQSWLAETLDSRKREGNVADIEASNVYCNSLGALARLIVSVPGSDQETQESESTKAFGTAFVVFKGQYTILMSCSNLFEEVSITSLKEVRSNPHLKIKVITCNFQKFDAQLLKLDHINKLCLLRVKEDTGADVVPSLAFREGNAAVGEKMYCISCPIYEMVMPEKVRQANLDPDFFNCNWFSLSEGYVSQISFSGDIELMKVQMRGFDVGCGGAPIIDRKGFVTGVFSCDSDSVDSHSAVRYDGIVSFFRNMFGASSPQEGVKRLAAYANRRRRWTEIRGKLRSRSRG